MTLKLVWRTIRMSQHFSSTSDVKVDLLFALADLPTGIIKV
jgi:hypothetical protein